MDELLREITALPKVLGCFVYSSNKGITSSSMPRIFTKNTITIIGTLLARSKQICSGAKLNMEAIDLRYNETLIVAKPLNQNSTLVTICEPGTNRALLDMSTNMVIKDISESLGSKPKTTPRTDSKSESEPSLRPIIAKIQDALADAIGPIAAPVLNDCVKKWSKLGAPSKNRLPDLAWMICKEIDDENLEASFMEKIKPYFL